MKSPKPNKQSKSLSGSKDLAPDVFDRRAEELTELLKACRDLSDILNPDELYATFAGIIRNKFGISKLGLFVYDPEKETFELIFSLGLGKLNFKFKRGRKKLWETILQDKPFAVVDQSGDPLFPKFLEKQDLKIKTQEADIALLDEKNKVKIKAGVRAYGFFTRSEFGKLCKIF